jgi:hypothetical protein
MSLIGLSLFAVVMIVAIALAARGMAAKASVPAEANVADVSFDANRYRAMQRLLSGDDWSFVASTVRSSKALRKARAERKRLFNRYLTNLETDFLRLHAAARALLLDAPEDRPELAQALVSQQIAFKRALIVTRLRLYAPALGDAAQSVGRLVDLVEGTLATSRQATASAVAAA